MRYAIFSDSHGDIESLQRAMLMCSKRGKIDHFVFLGDGLRDFKASSELMAKLNSDYECTAVRGNCDIGINNVADIAIIKDGDINIMVCHGNSFGVKRDYSSLAFSARKNDAKIALFGHTHSPYNGEFHSIYLINPGSCHYPYTRAAILEINKNGIFTSNLLEE